MKRFYNNTLMSGALSKALRVLALLCVLMGFSASAWAWDNELIIWGSDNNKYYHDISNGSCTVNLSSTGDYYFFIKDNKDNGKEKKLSGYSQMTNGNSTDWRFDGTNSDCGLKVNNGETGNFTFKLRWDNSTPVVSVVYPVAVSTTYHAKYPWDGGDNWYWKEFDKNNQIEGTFRGGCMNVATSENNNASCINVTNSGSLNNGDPCIFTYNPSTNQVTATAKGGGGGGDTPGGGTGTDFDFVLDTKTGNFGGWISNGEVYAIFRENVGGKTGETRQVQLELCDSDNKLAFYDGGLSFTRTDGSTWTPKEVYVYSGGGNDAFANWDGTKNCMVITNWGLMTNSSGGCTMTTFTGDCDGTSGGGGGGGGGESSTYVAFDCLYLNTGGSTLWNLPSEAVNFYLYLYNDAKGTKKSVKATVCPDASDIFYAEVPDGEWEGYLWIRKDANNNTDPAVNWNNAGVKDQTDNCSIYKDLTTITGWENANFTNGTYSGSCGCAGGSGDIDDDTEEYVKGTSVLLSYEADERTKGNWVLSAFLEALCAVEDITQYGFYLCETDKEGGCKPTEESYTYKVDATTKTPLEKYGSFTGIASGLSNAWYGYRAFVVADGETILSPNTKYFNNKCKYELTGDTVYVTIDNSLTVNNECDLKFKSINDAWATLKTIREVCKAEKVTYGWKQDKITLIKPVVMQLVPTGINYNGFDKVGLSGGDQTTVQATFFRNINMSGGAPLIVRSIDYLNNGARATIQHVAIRRSKNITLNYLNIVGASREIESADNAIDIDNGVGSGNLEGLGTDWNCASISAEDNKINANIVIKNCQVVSYGFTCVHVSAYNGITFENNEFRAMYDFEEAETIKHDSKGNQANNTALWGASAKFLNSKNIAFIRNNFTGQHATSILLQGSQNVLIYDNVFWHDNGVKSSANTVAIIRLISYGGCAGDNPLQNIGIYYNTMFLKDNSVGEGKYHHFDFFRIGGNEQEGNTEYYIPGTIEFDYNNCYSYDKDVYGKNYTGSDNYTSADNKTKYLQTMTEDAWCNSFKYNNFWSVYEDNKNPKPTRSEFALGSGCNSDEGKNNFINVQNLVCKTSPEQPGSLVIKGNDLNIGAFIQTDASGLLTDEMQMIDRLGNARPYDPNALQGKGSYTLGAYQQSLGTEVSKIIWNGNVSTEWDNRNNWYKPNGQLVTCVDILTEDLEVVIPAPNTTKYPVPEGGVVKYPTLPDIAKDVDFSSRTTQWHGEEVNAGKGQIANPTKVANGITMEYGAALIGVEQLAAEGQTVRYTQASTELIVPRKKWILVGPMIRPFNEKGVADNMLSGHYFIEKQLPHVWMHEAEMSGDKVSWKNPFPDLNVVVPANKVFAIQIPNMYGTNLMLSDTLYNKYFNAKYDGNAPITYTFTGRFTNEGALPTYKGLQSGVPALLNNSYPANINVETLIARKGGTVQTYNYSKKSFEKVKSGLIIAQHGFVYSSNATELTIPLEAFEVSNTEHRSIAEYMPEVSITVSNQAAEASSTVHLSIDWLKDDAINYDTDAPKVFNAQETKLPDLYIMRYNEKWAGVRVPTYDEPIPLGIRVSAADQTFVFSLENAQDMASVMLEDRLEGKTYDLLAGETCTVSGLKVGDCEGRFFLNVGAKEQTEDDDVTTDVEDITTDNSIYITSKGNAVVVSCSSDVELQTIVVNDMSGRTATYNVSGQYVELNLPVVQGVYLVKVIGDTATKTGKVILK